MLFWFDEGAGVEESELWDLLRSHGFVEGEWKTQTTAAQRRVELLARDLEVEAVPGLSAAYNQGAADALQGAVGDAGEDDVEISAAHVEAAAVVGAFLRRLCTHFCPRCGRDLARGTRCECDPPEYLPEGSRFD